MSLFSEHQDEMLSTSVLITSEILAEEFEVKGRTSVTSSANLTTAAFKLWGEKSEI